MGVNGIYGLSGSSIDVESMVKVGMMTKQSEYDKMYKKEIKNEWVKSAYADVYSSLNTFNNSTLSNYKMQSTMNAMKATSSDTASVTATANGAAVAMAHKVVVGAMSSNAYLLSAQAITRTNTSTAAQSSIYLKDNILNKIEEGQVSYSYNGNTYTTKTAVYDTDGTTIKSYTLGGGTDSSGNAVADAVDMSADSFDTNVSTYKIYASDGKYQEVNASDKAISFTVAGSTDTLTADQLKKQTISYTYADLAGGKTYNDLVSDIKATNANVQASYDATNDTFSLYNSSGGKSNTITLTMAAADVTDTSGKITTANGGTYAATLFNHLHLEQSTNGALSGTEVSYTANQAKTVTGTDGSVTVDGKTYTGITDNKITVSGVTYTLLNTNSTASTVTVSQDTDSIINTVKQFVTDYNKMIDSLNDKIYETKYSDYQPLTKSQEASMSATQIEQWNTKAKSGLLYHSSILRDIVSNMREALYTPVSSVNSNYNSASALGITSSTDQGHITLDEDKLKKALAADPDSVYQVFASSQDTAKTGDKVGAASDYANTGIANRLYDSLNTGLKTMKSYAGTSSTTDDSSSLGSLISNLKTKMSDFKTQMDAYEDVLYSKYDAMETAIQQLSSQLSMVTSSNS